ncbi:cytochrome P450-dit2 [Ceratobasidium sp. 423]|nr:cytochrome P450-dit2 [Ceratobasidium sp. 423]
MSQVQQTIPNFDQFKILLDKAMAAIQAQPIELSAAVVSAAIIYSLKRLTTPSPYSNLNGRPRKTFMSGHMNDLLSPHNIAFHDALQDTYGSVSKVYGAFGKEDLYVSDPRFMHEVLVKEADTVFRHPQYFYDINNASFGPGLISSAGARHKAQRKVD